jgi:hypothetical protein
MMVFPSRSGCPTAVRASTRATCTVLPTGTALPAAFLVVRGLSEIGVARTGIMLVVCSSSKERAVGCLQAYVLQSARSAPLAPPLTRTCHGPRVRWWRCLHHVKAAALHFTFGVLVCVVCLLLCSAALTLSDRRLAACTTHHSPLAKLCVVALIEGELLVV